ncbi:CHAP domain-containing protein [Streptococcus dentasini]
MKKEKLVALTLLLILSGAYLVPPLTRAETAERTVRRSKEEGKSSESSSSSDDISFSEDSTEGEETKDEDENKAETQTESSAQEVSSSASDQSSADSKETFKGSPQPSSEEKVESEQEKSKTEMADRTEDSSVASERAVEETEITEKEVSSDAAKGSSSDLPSRDQQAPVKSYDPFNLSLPTYSESSGTVTSSSQASVIASPLWSATSVFDNDDSEVTPAFSYTKYVEHWSGKNAYSHNLLSHRYGIKAEQLDGYLNSLGIAYDRNRINGQRLLKWERESGLDVRAIIAIALFESSLGTAGVAKEAGANMFGYGAFDTNVSNATHFSDEIAIRRMTAETIIQNKNWSFKRQDDKAIKYAQGQLDLLTEGGVYFTDTSGTGKRRAQAMQDIDRWIDQHGGTPTIPEELKNFSGTSLEVVPAGYHLSKPMHIENYLALSYPWGQCTWYVYNRAHELGYQFDAYMGNGGAWIYKSGYELTHEPKLGYAVSFAPNQAGADPNYGHVAIVEEVRKDGSILISESNALGLGLVSYRTFTAKQATELTYVIGKR